MFDKSTVVLVETPDGNYSEISMINHESKYLLSDKCTRTSISRSFIIISDSQWQSFVVQQVQVETLKETCK